VKGSSRKIVPASELLLVAQKLLEDNGYIEVPVGDDVARSNARMFESPNSIVMIAAFDSWADLRESWADYQGAAVEAITKRLRREDPKAWDGYLVLLTPSLIPLDQQGAANEIRSDTSRLRKLLGTGDEIESPSAVKRTLLPLLPINVAPGESARRSGLDALPRILKKHGINPDETEAIVEAFKAREPLLERLHGLVNSK
jgi:hypothetical protein